MGWRPPNYRRGYTGRNYHVTGGHESEAEAAERARKPTRLGRLVLRLLGYRGPIGPLEPVEHPVTRHEHPNDGPDSRHSRDHDHSAGHPHHE